jgi:hypothetical protein
MLVCVKSKTKQELVLEPEKPLLLYCPGTKLCQHHGKSEINFSSHSLTNASEI